MLMKEGLGAQAIARIEKALRGLGVAGTKRFEKRACSAVQPLEMRERVDCVIGLLHEILPHQFSEAAAILKCIPSSWDYGDKEGPLRGFAAWPLIDYVAVHGLAAPKTALDVFERLTPLFSAEFAIRAFLEHHRDATLNRMLDWVLHDDAHVRRLVSEGLRPYLPWGKKVSWLVEAPDAVLPYLDQLYKDPSEYVRRSVANNLNDIAKISPALVIERCQQWRRSSDDNTQALVRHACRTLVKQGYPPVFELLGFYGADSLSVRNLSLDKSTVKEGEKLRFSFGLQAEKDVNCVVDYALYYQKKNGELAPKVFKLKNIKMQKGEKQSLSKDVSFKAVTTRQHYAGRHELALHVNGIERARVAFELKK